MFDPGPGAFEIPLPSGFVGAQAQDNERKVDVRQNHGVAVHGPIVPRRSQLIASDSERKANEVVFGFVLPYHGDTHDFSQPAPNGIGALTLITDQKVTGLTVSGPGVGPREERVLGGHKYWVMSLRRRPGGGRRQVHAHRTALDGFQRAVVRGRRLAGAGVRRVRLRAPADVGAGGKRGGGPTVAEERKRLIAKRETLFVELVALERAARVTDKPVPVDQRRQLVTRLEEVYQDIAALDKPRAA